MAVKARAGSGWSREPGAPSGHSRGQRWWKEGRSDLSVAFVSHSALANLASSHGNGLPLGPCGWGLRCSIAGAPSLGWQHWPSLPSHLQAPCKNTPGYDCCPGRFLPWVNSGVRGHSGICENFSQSVLLLGSPTHTAGGLCKACGSAGSMSEFCPSCLWL